MRLQGGIINAIGLSNPGVDNFLDELRAVEDDVPLIASIYGASPEEFQEVSSRIEEYVDMIELNVSCPPAMSGCGASRARTLN